MKKRMFSIMWWWSLTFALFCAIRLDLSDAAAAAKSSSSSQRSDKFEVLRNSDNSYSNEKSDKSQQTGDDDNNGALKGGGDIIPIPDHLLKSDYDDHHYSYEDEHLEGYDDYEYHSNSGPKHSGPKSLNGGSNQLGSEKNKMLSGSNLHLDDDEYHLSGHDMDPSDLIIDYDDPIFYKQPTDAFVIKNQPATLHCRVSHALDVHFKCNSEVVTPTKREDHVEPESGIRYTDASVDITRDQVEHYNGEFHCSCVVITKKGAKVSKTALVTTAYLKRHFETDPYNQQVARGQQVQMRCHPPRGRPKPVVYWKRNGRRIDGAKDKNYMITNDGHLILVAARLSDTGNYTCIAENIANLRPSNTAQLTVYVDGEWSFWSSWDTTCSNRCGKGVVRRTRECDSPAPINGGNECPGNSVQKKSCTSMECPDLKLDGNWASWTSWSSCSPECFQHRRRTCTNPPPRKPKGRYCFGRDLQSRNCTDGFCQGTEELVIYGTSNGLQNSKGNHNDHSRSTETTSKTVVSHDVTLYIIFGVALLVFVIVIIVIVNLLKRKNANPGYTLTSTDYGYGMPPGSEENNPHENKKGHIVVGSGGPSNGLNYTPDIVQQSTALLKRSQSNQYTQQHHPHHGRISNGNGTPSSTTPATTLCYEYSLPDPNSNHSKFGGLNTAPSNLNHAPPHLINGGAALSFNGGNGFIRPSSEHHYEQPMVVLPVNTQSPSDSMGHPTRSESGVSSSSTSKDAGHHSSPGTSVGGTFDRCDPVKVVGQGASLASFPKSSTPLPSLPTPPPPPSGIVEGCGTTNTTSSGGSTGSSGGGRSSMSAQQRILTDTKFTTWASVTNAGARLVIPDTNISMTVPCGAVAPGHIVDLFISVSHGCSSVNVQHPRLRNNKETLLSPLVICGPAEASAHLKKSVIVSMPHCASLRHGNWSVTLLQAENMTEHSTSSLDNGISSKDKNGNGRKVRNQQNHQKDIVIDNSWKKVVTLGQETINTPIYAQLDINTCHLITDSLSAYALVGESASSMLGPSNQSDENLNAVKCLRLAAFAQDGPLQPADLTVRVYCLPDTDDALSHVTESERRYNGRMLDQPVSVLFSDSGDDLCLRVENINNMWTCQKGAEYLEVPFGHVWSSSNPSLHCSFTFRPTGRDQMGSNILSTTLSIWQKHQTQNMRPSLLKINCDLSSVSSHNTSHTYVNDNANVENGNIIPSPYATTITAEGRFRITPTMMKALSRLLDPPNKQGNDWRLLADRLNVNRYVTFFATQPSPTEAILCLWEARNRELLALSNLMNTLRGMGRFDAAVVLEETQNVDVGR